MNYHNYEMGNENKKHKKLKKLTPEQQKQAWAKLGLLTKAWKMSQEE